MFHLKINKGLLNILTQDQSLQFVRPFKERVWDHRKVVKLITRISNNPFHRIERANQIKANNLAQVISNLLSNNILNRIYTLLKDKINRHLDNNLLKEAKSLPLSEEKVIRNSRNFNKQLIANPIKRMIKPLTISRAAVNNWINHKISFNNLSQ